MWEKITDRNNTRGRLRLGWLYTHRHQQHAAELILEKHNQTSILNIGAMNSPFNLAYFLLVYYNTFDELNGIQLEPLTWHIHDMTGWDCYVTFITSYTFLPTRTLSLLAIFASSVAWSSPVSFALKARGWSTRSCSLCVELPGLLSELTAAPDLYAAPITSDLTKLIQLGVCQSLLRHSCLKSCLCCFRWLVLY